MSNNFDDRNQLDYDNNTKRLNSAIDKIRATPSLSPSIAELSRLTGIHRNTISSRKWPCFTLREIKKERQLKSKLSIASQKNPVKLIEDKLANAKRELVYWFNKNLDNEKQIKQLEQNLQRMSQARNDYESMLEQERQKNQELAKQLNLMRELIL